ncbi:ABC transporter permease [Streptomyces malaysiensis]|uniref:ABC transporter permease n=1 Tax=Streptomyces malaysiensis TaxID=92644 RepID=A0A7X6AW72_STRMQ|nr:ABC transporter permease [Streptomyces malaysiensis]
MAYGTVMNLQGWTLMQGMASGISYVPGDPLDENLARFVAYCLATSLGWDLPRAVVTMVLTLTLGGAILKALRRATRRAAFEAPVAFEAPAFEAKVAFEDPVTFETPVTFKAPPAAQDPAPARRADGGSSA